MRAGGVRWGGVSFRTPLAPSLETRNSKETGPNSVAMSRILVTAPGRAQLAGMACYTALTFLLCRQWVFKQPPNGAQTVQALSLIHI